MNEFTGERVVPGEVNVDLWNEHVSRYALAARLTVDASVLDMGCGTGYGSAELACRARSVTGIDVASDAVHYAREHYQLPNLQFDTASCTALPYADASFDAVVCFEVIEHLENWPDLIREARRVLRPDGLFIVSTPNRLYYAESRNKVGPNPFHEHEFELDEFKAALQQQFQSVDILLQNRTECMAFYPPRAGRDVDARLDASAGPAEEANFFLAICSPSSLPDLRNFVFVPRAANILKEREQHIAKLDYELNLNKDWLIEARGERDALHARLKETQNHLEEHNRWAQQLELQLAAAQARIVDLQDQFAAEQRAGVELSQKYEDKLAELDHDIQSKTQWALDTEKRLTAEIDEERGKHRDTLSRLEAAERTAEERSAWALELKHRLDQLEAQFNHVRSSRWIAVGRRLGVGPQL